MKIKSIICISALFTLVVCKEKKPLSPEDAFARNSKNEIKKSSIHTAQKYFVLRKEGTRLFSQPDSKSEPSAILSPGDQILVKDPKDFKVKPGEGKVFVRAELGDKQGYIPTDHIGVVDPSLKVSSRFKCEVLTNFPESVGNPTTIVFFENMHYKMIYLNSDSNLEITENFGTYLRYEKYYLLTHEYNKTEEQYYIERDMILDPDNYERLTQRETGIIERLLKEKNEYYKNPYPPDSFSLCKKTKS